VATDDTSKIAYKLKNSGLTTEALKGRKVPVRAVAFGVRARKYP